MPSVFTWYGARNWNLIHNPIQKGGVPMTTQAKKVVKIKPLEGYTVMSDADIVQRGTAAQTGLTGNSNFQNLPATCMCTWFESFDHRGLRPPVFLHRLRLRRNGLPLQ